MNVLRTPGVVERLNKAMAKAQKIIDPEQAYRVLEDAVIKEVERIEAIKDMPAFRMWIEGERFDLSKVRGGANDR